MSAEIYSVKNLRSNKLYPYKQKCKYRPRLLTHPYRKFQMDLTVRLPSQFPTLVFPSSSAVSSLV